MFLRKRISKGKVYWSLCESFRDNNGHVKQKMVKNLGITDNALEILKSNSQYNQFYVKLLSLLNIESESNRTSFQIINGNSLLLSQLLGDVKVNTCVTSPPYYAQRDYGIPKTYWPPFSYVPMLGVNEVHMDDWIGCLGLESSPEMYVGHLVLIFREVYKILKDDGTLWLNLGDTYYLKNLIGIPWRVAFALQADGWLFRVDNIWNKPNPTPESVKDRTTRCHEFIFLFSKSQHYYYNSDAILEPYISKIPKNKRDKQAEGYQANFIRGNRFSLGARDYYSRGGKNKRTVWSIPVNRPEITNYATFPINLAKTCILAGCPTNGIVLDVFGGTGTTAEAAKILNRNCICVELNAESVKAAYKRINGDC